MSAFINARQEYRAIITSALNVCCSAIIQRACAGAFRARDNPALAGGIYARGVLKRTARSRLYHLPAFHAGNLIFR